MSAVPTLANSAVPSALVPGDLVNNAVWQPASERYPGSVDPAAYDGAVQDPLYPIQGPPAGDWTGTPFGGPGPGVGSGGGIQDTSWLTGTDGPMEAWDSSAGQPFAPSGAVDPDLHGEDTGAVLQAQYTVPAFIGSLQRSTGTGQTYNREYAFEPVQGQYVPAPNGRADYDQRQTWDPSPHDGGGWAPWDPGYSERPILNNVAYTATPVTSVPTQYGVSGALPDRSQFQVYAAQQYEQPANPSVALSGAPAASTGTGWVLG